VLGIRILPLGGEKRAKLSIDAPEPADAPVKLTLRFPVAPELELLDEQAEARKARVARKSGAAARARDGECNRLIIDPP
jgi:hypothetical protein